MTRTAPTPWLKGNVWYARVPRLDAPGVLRPIGVRGKDNRDVARNVCAFLQWLRSRRESFLLDAMAGKKVSVGAAFTAYTEGRLDAFIVEARDGVTDVDIEPYVARWQRELARRQKPNAASRAKYLKQVRTLIPDGVRFPRSAFTKQRIRDWLDGLGISQPNRHRAALSSFAEFLLFEDVIAGNPVKRVPRTSESDPRTRHLSQADAKKLLEALAPEFRPIHALMLATGMEFGAAQAVDPQTVTESTVYAQGTKKHHRRRTCTITERWCWAWEIARAEILSHRDGERPFGKVSVHASLRALRKALGDAKLDTSYTQHDHRHTWAVQAVRDGLPLHAIAHQLGHRDATMVLKVYGRFQPTQADFSGRNVTASATAPTNNPTSTPATNAG